MSSDAPSTGGGPRCRALRTGSSCSGTRQRRCAGWSRSSRRPRPAAETRRGRHAPRAPAARGRRRRGTWRPGSEAAGQQLRLAFFWLPVLLRWRFGSARSPRDNSPCFDARRRRKPSVARRQQSHHGDQRGVRPHFHDRRLVALLRARARPVGRMSSTKCRSSDER